MDFTLLIALILVTFFCVAVSGMCSIAEATLLTLDQVRLESLKREGKLYARIWLTMKRNIDRPISAILIINTIANTGGAAVAGSLFSGLFGDSWLWVYLIFLTLAILFAGEIGPKVIGSIYAEQIAPFLAVPLAAAIRILAPLIKMTEFFSKRLRGKGQQSTMSVVDIEVLAGIARARKVIATEQEEIIANAASLQHVKVKDSMIPREWIVFLRLDKEPLENFRIGQHAMHTRYPVSYTDSPNKIMGYINYKDLIGFRPHGNDLNLESFIRPILSLSPDMDLNKALRMLSAKRHHIAMVKDDDGDVVGMITMEDVIEELVGEIEDEFDLSSSVIIPITDRIWRVGASLTMDRLAGVLARDLKVEDQNQTLGQWLGGKIGSRLYPGVNHEHEGIRFTVQQSRLGKIFQVIVETEDEAKDF